MIAVAGVSHRTAPLPVRESLAFPKERLSEALKRLRTEPGVDECVILSTCNRVELYARGDDTARDVLVPFLCRFHGREPEELTPHSYQLEGEAAVRHAFRVAASLDSMVLGESQILGQVKDAYEAAEEAGTLGPVLGALRNRTLAAAKRVRAETTIGKNAVSVSHVAVELARKIFGDLEGRNVLLVGAGKMSALAARQIVRGGAHATVLGGRSLERAEALAKALGGRAAPFAALGQELARADVVISGTGAPGLVIRREDVEAARAARRQPLFLIDIAVPRAIDASVRSLDGVFLYDLDDLKSVAEANLRERQKQAAAAEAIVAHEVAEFLGWRKSLGAIPLLVELRRRGDEVRRAEIEKLRKRLGPLTAEQEAAIEAATVAIVNKLLHPPTVHLKEIARSGRADQLRLISDLLGLEKPPVAEAAEGEAAQTAATAMPLRLRPAR
ncbi:MAG: glutamyl-tRNA reductase [Candidatus Rokubacteria bacterium]|nr:glutamyl-tRNA reductase [Candidatus Rokubacteria bacterium]